MKNDEYNQEGRRRRPESSPRGWLTGGVNSALLLWIAAVATAAAGPSVFPLGVTQYDPLQAYNCDILFDSTEGTYLIDMDGHVLHHWGLYGVPPRMLDPKLVGGTKGEIGAQLARGEVTGEKGINDDLTFGYVDWQGKTIWQWGRQAPGGALRQHHDWELLPNGDTLFLAWRVGRLKGFGDRLEYESVIYEVSRAGGIVWSWRASQHLSEMGFTAEQLGLIKSEAPNDFRASGGVSPLHINAMSQLGPNHWAAAGDKRFAPDNIIISSRNANFLAIISYRTGRIVWRLGPNFPPIPIKRLYGHPWSSFTRKVPYRLDRLSGQHDAHMIPEGLPGAGDILVFDNEGEGGYPPMAMRIIAGSRVLEINPVTHQVVWEYIGTKESFFSSFFGSAQRLPNGNTLIDEGTWGRFFQVTPKGRIVWEYMNPFALKTSSIGNIDPAMNLSRAVYRVQAVPYDWVPEGVPHSQIRVRPPAPADFHIAPGPD